MYINETVDRLFPFGDDGNCGRIPCSLLSFSTKLYGFVFCSIKIKIAGIVSHGNMWLSMVPAGCVVFEVSALKSPGHVAGSFLVGSKCLRSVSFFD